MFWTCCCCSAYWSSCHWTVSGTNLLDYHTFHCNDYFVIEAIQTCLGVFDGSMFLWISLNSCPLNLLLAGSHPAEIITLKRFILRHKNMTRVGVEPRSFDQGCHKNNAFTLSVTLLTWPVSKRKTKDTGQLNSFKLLPNFSSFKWLKNE